MNTPEQRQSQRSSPTRAAVSITDVESGVEFNGDVMNVSLGGVMLHAPMQPVIGADLELKFEHPESPMLRLQVVRVERQREGFDIAGHLSAR